MDFFFGLVSRSVQASTLDAMMTAGDLGNRAKLKHIYTGRYDDKLFSSGACISLKVKKTQERRVIHIWEIVAILWMLRPQFTKIKNQKYVSALALLTRQNVASLCGGM